MRKLKSYLAYILVFMLVLSPFNGVVSSASSSGGNNEPALIANLSLSEATDDNPLHAEIIKPINGPAIGNFSFEVTPQGAIETEGERGPIEVVFIMDTSGSMDYKTSGKFIVEKKVCVEWGWRKCKKYDTKTEIVNEVKRITAAKMALNNAIDQVFSQNYVEGDRYALVSFASGIKENSTIGLTHESNKIKEKVETLDADGGTNYTQALERAKDILTTSPNKNSQKYIIFLTDGEPTAAEINVGTERYNYIIYTDDSSEKYKLVTDRKGNKVWQYVERYNKNQKPQIEQIIKNSISTVVSSIAAKNIPIYSIGFGTSESEFNYLKSISEKSEKGNSENLSPIFNEFATTITEYGLKDAKIKVKLPKTPNAPGNVELNEGANAKPEGEYAVIDVASSVPYVEDGPLPVLENSLFNLSLKFSKIGEYKFNDIQFIYKNINGEEVTVNLASSENPVVVNVTDSVAPQFTGTISYNKDVSKLEKEGTKNSESNSFDVNYELSPPVVTETLSNVVIKQPLPNGIIPSDVNLPIKEEGGVRYVEIAVQQDDINNDVPANPANDDSEEENNTEDNNTDDGTNTSEKLKYEIVDLTKRNPSVNKFPGVEKIVYDNDFLGLSIINLSVDISIKTNSQFNSSTTAVYLVYNNGDFKKINLNPNFYESYLPVFGVLDRYPVKLIVLETNQDNEVMELSTNKKGANKFTGFTDVKLIEAGSWKNPKWKLEIKTSKDAKSPTKVMVIFSDGSIEHVNVEKGDKSQSWEYGRKPILLYMGGSKLEDPVVDDVVEDEDDNGETTLEPKKLTATLKLLAETAVETKLPETTIHFKIDEIDLGSKIKADDTIKNVVKLNSGTRFSPIIGNHTGIILVTTKDSNPTITESKYGVKGNVKITKAVKTMEFAKDTNERYVRVQYGDDSFGLVTLYDVGISLDKASYDTKIGKSNAITITVHPAGFNPSDITIKVADNNIVKISPQSGQTIQRNIEGLKQGMTKISARISYNDFDIDNNGNLLEQLKSKTATALVKVSGEVTKPGGTDKDW